MVITLKNTNFILFYAYKRISISPKSHISALTRKKHHPEFCVYYPVFFFLTSSFTINVCISLYLHLSGFELLKK